MADLIDPTQTGKYPVILSPRLLNQSTDEIFTGVRYNHKPSSIPDSSRARLKPSVPGQTASYDLNVLSSSNPSTTHAYAGTRTSSNGKYVLYFDPEKQAFVLDKVDSTFNMNLTRTPETSDPDALGRKFPHIDSNEASGSSTKKPSAKKEPTRKDRARSPQRKKEFATKAERRRVKDVNNLAMPTFGASTPAPNSTSASKQKSSSSKPSKAKQPAQDDEDEEDEGDDLLLVEYPDGGGPKSQNRDYSPAFPSVRKFDDFMDQRESEADDADDESLNDESDVDFKLPSPVNNPVSEPMDMDDEEQEEEGDTRGGSDMEDDLEKDLAEAFGTAGDEEGSDSPAARDRGGDESEISEED